jgi:threonyl-tRNA synthetase
VCRNRTRECYNHTHTCQNYSRVCGNHILRVNITLCVYYSHYACIYHTRVCRNYTRANWNRKNIKKNLLANISPLIIFESEDYLSSLQSWTKAKIDLESTTKVKIGMHYQYENSQKMFYFPEVNILIDILLKNGAI